MSASIAGPWPRGGSWRMTVAPLARAMSGVRSLELSTTRICASGAYFRISSIILSTLGSSFIESMPTVSDSLPFLGAIRAITAKPRVLSSTRITSSPAPRSSPSARSTPA